MTTTQAEATTFEQGYQKGYLPGTVGARRAPWDIGRAQSAVVELAARGAFSGAVLDIGSGLGDNSIHLASTGLTVTGIDSAPTAVQTAKDRAAEAGVDVEFAVADATSLAGYEDRFDTILDSGLYHCLTASDRKEYVAALARVSKPGARLHLLSFTNELPEAHFLVPVTEETLRADFVAPWTVEALNKVRYQTTLDFERLQARVPGIGAEIPADGKLCPGVEIDDDGAIWFDAWHLEARLG
ncbi:class I SAM-dependent methyltransferase [Streptomyces sp. NPDC002513]